MVNILTWSNEQNLDLNAVLRLCRKHNVPITRVGNSYLAEVESLKNMLVMETKAQAQLFERRSAAAKERNQKLRDAQDQESKDVGKGSKPKQPNPENPEAN